MTVLKFSCWNSAGIRASANSTASKMSFFNSQFPKNDFSIAAFIETHHKDKEDLPEELLLLETTHHIIHTPTQQETHAGIVALLSKQLEVKSQNEVIPGRLLNIKFILDKTEYNLSIFYGPRWRDMKKNEIKAIIDHFSSAHNVGENSIIMGDFNFADLDVDKGKNMDGKDKTITSLWEIFKSEVAVRDPYRLQYPKRKIYSFVAPAGKSRGDRLYVSEDILNSVSNMKYINTTFNTAHKIMTFDLQRGRTIGPGYWKMNSSVINDSVYVREIEDVYNEINDLNIANPKDWWDLFIVMVQGVTLDYCQRKAKVTRKYKEFITRRMQDLESIPYDEMSYKQKEEYINVKSKYDDIVKGEIQGYEIRTRGHPRYEINEPDIDFYSKLEKRYKDKNIICELQDDTGNLKSKNEELLNIAQNYYTNLFAAGKVNHPKQHQLLRNIKKRLSPASKRVLDSPLTDEELLRAVMQLLLNKSPGPDGITAEFYKKFWYLIKDKYLQYINAAKRTTFGKHKNMSVTTLIYKLKGKIYILDNYRPISLINVDLKILSKALTNRLKPILPSIIHWSQTAVYGRKIDHTVHLLRDLIDLVNKEDTEGAFIFLDQEKAFDRVDHDLLFKTMDAFGFGEEFIKWIKLLYTDASTKVKINGFFTENIPLRRGVRQGCPLSALLYVLVIELLSLLLRNNPNIVGFQVGGEKIISLHYADDAIISIKQNQCFKEVIKDLETYQEASGAKVNLGKTKGLWVGKWKNRIDKPLNIRWTNENIMNLGVYFGNLDPATKTFEEIIPEIKRSLNYWKQFKLCTFAKARVIEIFHASKLWYAASFYNIPAYMKKELQDSFFQYINFPHSTATVSQAEMKKLRLHGGVKLIDIQTKTDTYKVKWLMELVTIESLHFHSKLIASLIGMQKGGLQGTEIFFTTHQYAKNTLKTEAQFYKSAIEAITKLNPRKKILDINAEKVFYNPTFKSALEKPLIINKTCEKFKAYTYGDIVSEHQKQQNGEAHKKYVAFIYEKIKFKDVEDRDENQIFDIAMNEYVDFLKAPHKFVYEQLIMLTYRDHPYTTKWPNYFQQQTINWTKVWEAINNPISLEDTKTIVWDQVHLNEYTTYSYNKWHNAQQICPFCEKVPDTKFHITIECPIVQLLWSEVEVHLQNIYQAPVTAMEMVFGLSGTTPDIILRNWLTFLLRSCIVTQENIAFHNKKYQGNAIDIKLNFNNRLKAEIWEKYNIFDNLGRLDYFTKTFGHNEYLIKKVKESWQVLTVFT